MFDLAWAAFLIFASGRLRVRPPGGFALYVVGYSGFRIFEESLRIDHSQHFFGFRLNMFVATGMTIIGLIWFAYTQRDRFHRARVRGSGGASQGPPEHGAGAGSAPATSPPDSTEETHHPPPAS